MKPLILAVLAFATLANSAPPALQTLAPEPHEQTTSLNSKYWAYLPSETTAAKLPLILFLHGGGGTGSDIHKIKGQPMGVWKGIQRFEKGPCIIVAPQCLRSPRESKDGGWQVDDLNLLLQDLKARFPIDSERIYLSGNSMGGYGAWMWGGHNPEQFAAIAPIVGGPKEVTPDLDQWASNLVKVPVYAFAGALDKVVPAERSERMVKAIRAAGGQKAKLKSYPNAGHDASHLVFASAEFYDWMFSQRKQDEQR
ncbi:prolyl oligopeptidase family serine peptidase [Pelagicoccus mobilis]|uniref:Prolyl oligopeptidase family serine peptidase n=1 Tax=Pelagicoccus mobilis TaxID=415221 RepID=A0A934RWL2_9BACT|nr:prolyl oligopeptidase family serine peptidase [Pelagicoccus mobilis]MBK1876106.1 prolyl oligopeptidase family serine peptidase [Pelagicoccus mobilis]